MVAAVSSAAFEWDDKVHNCDRISINTRGAMKLFVVMNYWVDFRQL